MTRMTLLIAAACVGLSAAGPLGHHMIASNTIDQIQSGKMDVAGELKDALKDEEAQRAFRGGAIGPDLCEKQSHYGNTSDLAQKMLRSARADLAKAKADGDDESADEAKKELAFAYGWLSHCSADLNVHPVVNGRAGDTFRDLDKGGKVSHGMFETQASNYIAKTLGKQKEVYDPYIPYRFLSKHVGVPAPDLINASKVLKAKAAGEIFGKNQVSVSDPELARLWEGALRGTMQDTKEFLKNPSGFKNWDLDSGRISSADFDALHSEVMKLNGGKLPDGWGKGYMDWYRAVQGLSPEQRQAKLRSLMGLPGAREAEEAQKQTQAPSTTKYPVGGSPSDTYPSTTYNGLQVTYSVSGVTILEQSDNDDWTRTRSWKGRLHSGGELRLSGSARRDSGWPPPQTSATLRVSVTVDGKTKSIDKNLLKDSVESFDVSLPIPADAKEGRVDLTLIGIYNVGTRNVQLHGTFKRE